MRNLHKDFNAKAALPQKQIFVWFVKFSSRAKVIRIGNGVSVNILLILPIIVTNQGHKCKIYTIVSVKKLDNLDMVLHVKNVIELEVQLHLRDLKFKS